MYLQVLGPSSRSVFRVPALFQVVRRIQGWMEKKMANLLEESYRMPKPQHVDEKLYEKIVLLLVLLLFFYVLITVTFIFKVLLMKVACEAQN